MYKISSTAFVAGLALTGAVAFAADPRTDLDNRSAQNPANNTTGGVSGNSTTAGAPTNSTNGTATYGASSAGAGASGADGSSDGSAMAHGGAPAAMASADDQSGAMKKHHRHSRMASGEMHGKGGSGSDQETMALNQLGANGYTDITDIQKSGHGYQATAMKDGRSQTVTIDPHNGAVGQGS